MALSIGKFSSSSSSTMRYWTLAIFAEAIVLLVDGIALFFPSFFFFFRTHAPEIEEAGRRDGAGYEGDPSSFLFFPPSQACARVRNFDRARQGLINTHNIRRTAVEMPVHSSPFSFFFPFPPSLPFAVPTRRVERSPRSLGR